MNNNKIYATIIAFMAIIATASAQISSTYCPEIALEDIRLEPTGKAHRYKLTLTLVNTGNLDAEFGGESKDEAQKVGWQLYWSSDDRFNAGDMFIVGDYFAQHILAPEQRIQESFELKIVEKNSFMQRLVLLFDPQERLMECDETNNVRVLSLPK